MFQTLNPGDCIGIFSPSSPDTATEKERYIRGKQYLENKGFHLVEGSLTGKQDGYRSGTPKERAEELNAHLRNPNVKMIMSSIGGTNSNSMLPYLDYEAFAKNPKIIVGYSDATAILLALYAKTNIPTFYGPALIPSFGEFEPLVSDTYHYFERFFCSPSVPYTIEKAPFWSDEMINWLSFEKPKTLYKNEWISIYDGIVEGRLIGGNNNAMYGFIGTSFFPKIKQGDILLIEDTMKNAAIVEKNMAMLKLHEVFDKVHCILLGKHEQYDDLGTGKQPVDILLEQLDGTQIPILANIDCSHTHPMFPLAIGKKIIVNTIDRSISYREGWL